MPPILMTETALVDVFLLPFLRVLISVYRGKTGSRSHLPAPVLSSTILRMLRDESWMSQAQRDAARLRRLRNNPLLMRDVLAIKPHPGHADMTRLERKQAAIGMMKARVMKRRSSRRSSRGKARSGRRGRGRGTGVRSRRGNRRGRGRGTASRRSGGQTRRRNR